MIKLSRSLGPIAIVPALLVAGTGCHPTASDAGQPAPPPPAEVGQLRAALTGALPDLGGVEFAAVPASGSCDDAPVAKTSAAIEDEAPPSSVLPPGAGEKRHFADGFLTLSPGSYKVCATPLDKAGKPSSLCARAEGTAAVMAEVTTEIALVSRCTGSGRGGLDTVVVLNSPPVIDELEIKKSKFITTCETAELAVRATDPDGDQLGYRWTVTGSPAGGAPGAVEGKDTRATFKPAGAGSYQLQVVVTDVHGAGAALTFPIHVSQGHGCTLVNLALNPSCTGFPSPQESDRGWGGGSNKCEIVDGRRSYEIWSHGLAFTGGHFDENGGAPWIEAAGVRRMVIDFGSARTFEQVVIWWHGVEHTPDAGTLEVWNGTSWVAIPGVQRQYGTMSEEGMMAGFSTSDIYAFAPVSGSKVRYSFDNRGRNIRGGFNVHGWIYEVEVLGAN